MFYQVKSLSSALPTQLEQLGTKAKEWVEIGGEKFLFKEGRSGTGEDWAEKVCCEIARLLNIPHAEYELAIFNARKGVLSPTLVPETGRLILGNELLAKYSEGYDQYARYQSRQHVLKLVLTVLKDQQVGLPLGWTSPVEISNAVSVFMGYLLLDALVCNQDRHHENWGLITYEGRLTLAATFDHASSLGRSETDDVRVRRLNTRDRGFSVQAYVERSRSGLYEKNTSPKAMLILDAFVECAQTEKNAAQYWLNRLEHIQPEDFSDILARIPDDWISAPARDFASAMLRINKGRILEACRAIGL